MAFVVIQECLRLALQSDNALWQGPESRLSENIQICVNFFDITQLFESRFTAFHTFDDDGRTVGVFSR